MLPYRYSVIKLRSVIICNGRLIRAAISILALRSERVMKRGRGRDFAFALVKMK
jgi:hypothetical protein